VTTLPTIQELKDQLQAAEQRAAATDTAIANAGADIDAEVLADLEAEFEKETGEVERISKAIVRQERLRDAKAAVPMQKQGDDGAPTSGRGRTKEPLTYRSVREGGTHSFFQDVYAAKKGSFAATARLQRHMMEMQVELRDLNTTDTTGGDFVPPVYLADEWAALARAGRPFADAVTSRPLPDVGMAFTIPKVSTGTAAAIQASENSGVQETDAATTDITIPVRTIAGQQDLSRQAFERTQPGLDEVLFADLAADYATKLDVQLLSGSGNSGQVKGILTDSAINAVSFTAATPTVPLLYPKIADAIQKIHTTRFMPPNAIFMHPRRWAWILAALDSSNRPLVTPYAPQNAVAQFSGVASEAIVGSMQGLTVFVDASIPATNGAGTNEDIVIVTRLSDNLLWESSPRARVFEEVGSGTLTVRLQVYGYVAYTTERYSKGHAKITGTGLVAPTF